MRPNRKKLGNYSAVPIHFPAGEARDRVEEAAQSLGLSVSAFIREAAITKAEKVARDLAKKDGKCPTCGGGHPRQAKAAA